MAFLLLVLPAHSKYKTMVRQCPVLPCDPQRLHVLINERVLSQDTGLVEEVLHALKEARVLRQSMLVHYFQGSYSHQLLAHPGAYQVW